MALPYPERFKVKFPLYFWITGPLLLILRLTLTISFLMLLLSTLLVLDLCRSLSGYELKRIRNQLHHISGRFFILCTGGRIKREGSPPPPGSLMVSDHRSWLDALIYLNDRSAAFIVTKNSSSWPVIGYLIKSLGNIYINKESIRDAKMTMEAVEERLIKGDSVIFFPEATTIDGEIEKGLPFKSSLFEAAVRLKKPVYCAALKYESCRGMPDASRVIAWGDWTPFPLHVIRFLMMPRFTAIVHYIKDPVESQNRKEMALQAQSSITRELDRIKKSAL